MENVEHMRTGGASERVSGGRRRGLEHALRDLVPTTLAAGAVAIAVAVAVGGSTSGLPAPFAPGQWGSDRVTSTPATPQPLGGRMSVRLGPKATRTSAPPGLGEQLMVAWPEATERPMADPVDSVLFGPIFLSEATDRAEAAVLPVGEAPAVPAVSEVVGPALADSPSDQTLIADVVVVAAPSEVQEAQRLQRPHRLKSPKGGPKAEAGAEPLIAVAASLSPSPLLADTSPETASGPAEEPSGDHGNDEDKDNGNGPGNGNRKGNDKHKAGSGQARHPG